MMKAVFFDLDNTLYDSEKYYTRAFKSISYYIYKNFKINQQTTYEILNKNWKRNTSMYNRIFDDLVEDLDLKININDIVKIFNEQKVEENDLFLDTIPVLKKLSNEYKIGIITDGNVLRQKRKIQKCGVESLVDLIVYTKTLQPKPSPVSFQYALNQLSSNNIQPFYVADNPKIDFIGAKKMNFTTIRIVRGEFKDVDSDKNVDYSIKTLKDVREIVETKL